MNTRQLLALQIWRLSKVRTGWLFIDLVFFLRFPWKRIRDLTKLRRQRQGERQKSNRFNEQNNNSARASRFLLHFFAVPAQLRREMAKF